METSDFSATKHLYEFIGTLPRGHQMLVRRTTEERHVLTNRISRARMFLDKPVKHLTRAEVAVTVAALVVRRRELNRLIVSAGLRMEREARLLRQSLDLGEALSSRAKEAYNNAHAMREAALVELERQEAEDEA